MNDRWTAGSVRVANARNNDAVWLFVKIRGGPNAPWRHARLLPISRSGSTRIACEASTNEVGIFCHPTATHRGDLSSDVVLEIDPTSLSESMRSSGGLEARVYGLEMVYVPDGPFSVGDRDTASVAHSSFYRSTASGAHGGPLRITSEAAIHVAPEADALYYHANLAQYEGDRAGPVPAEFPKGTRAFYHPASCVAADIQRQAGRGRNIDAMIRSWTIL